MAFRMTFLSGQGPAAWARFFAIGSGHALALIKMAVGENLAQPSTEGFDLD
jgi:hypothetical protein